MADRQAGRSTTASVFSSRVIVCFLDVEKELRQAAGFRPRGSLKINRRIHRDLSFLSLPK